MNTTASDRNRSHPEVSRARSARAVWQSLLLPLLLATGGSTSTAADPTPNRVQPPPVPASTGIRSELSDQGPVFFGTIRNRLWEENTTMKGIVVKLGTNDTDYVCYDEDLLRVSLLWTGAFLNFPNRGREQIQHPQPAEVAGVVRFGSRPIPGWSKGGSFEDPRPERRGPLPRDWAKYQGVSLHGNQVVLRYSVGDATVLELPSLESTGEASGFTRTLELGPTKEALGILLATSESASPLKAGISSIRAASPETLSSNVPPAAASGDLAAILYASGEELSAFKMVAGPAGATLRIDPGNRIVLVLPPLTTPTRVKVLQWTGSRASWKNFADLVAKSPAPIEVKPLTRPGPARWNRTLEQTGYAGTNRGPFQIDLITEPRENPWNLKYFFSAVDFFKDGSAAVSSFHGDVWLVRGLDRTLQKIQWKRFATGLFQPLGLKIVDETVYVTCRDALVRLQDLNRDGEADFYENFNNDTVVTPNYHEFALDLDTDSAGNFYFAKGAPWPPDVKSPHQGTMMKVSKDGSRLEVIGTGLRAPNGVSVSPKDEVFFSDNEGNYIPTSKISLIRPGNLFYGMLPTAHRPPPSEFEPPICWLPKTIDNSSGGMVWVTGGKWGPLEGSMLFLSYGRASLFSVMQETVNGRVQAGVAPFPFRFPAGVMRARFNPVDGQLYLVGLRGWQTSGARDGGFFRMRYTGEPLHWPLQFHAKTNGLELEFSLPVTPESAKDPANWALERWNYVWSPDYGSPEVTTAESRQKGHDKVDVAEISLAGDGKKVFLKIPGMKPAMQMRVRFKLAAIDGNAISRDLYLTLHNLAD
jgi:hypothetical protein